MSITEFMATTKPNHGIRNRVKCADGFSLSVQASETHYCSPRDDDGPWYEVEVGYPEGECFGLLDKYSDGPKASVFGYVPVGIVDQIIEQHGGIV